MKLKKKTRKRLRRLAESAGALGATFLTELLVELSASFAAQRGRAEAPRGRGARRARHSDGNAEHEHDALPRTADSH